MYLYIYIYTVRFKSRARQSESGKVSEYILYLTRIVFAMYASDLAAAFSNASSSHRVEFVWGKTRIAVCRPFLRGTPKKKENTRTTNRVDAVAAILFG